MYLIYCFLLAMKREDVFFTRSLHTHTHKKNLFRLLVFPWLLLHCLVRAPCDWPLVAKPPDCPLFRLALGTFSKPCGQNAMGKETLLSPLLVWDPGLRKLSPALQSSGDYCVAQYTWKHVVPWKNAYVWNLFSCWYCHYCAGLDALQTHCQGISPESQWDWPQTKVGEDPCLGRTTQLQGHHLLFPSALSGGRASSASSPSHP